MRSTRRLAAVAVVGMLASACGGGSTADDAATGGTSTAAAPGVAAARAWVAENTQNPTTIAIGAPLSKRPASGRHIVKLVAPQPVDQVVSNGAKAAADALGWRYTAINVTPDPEGIQKAFQSALELTPKPDVISVAGYPAVTYAAQLAEAKRRGIAVISQTTTDKPGAGDGIVATLGGPAQLRALGKHVAAYVVAASNGTAQVAMFSVSAYPILGEFVAGFKDAVKQWCPGCSVVDVDQQATDVGTKTPQSVVSTFQRNPKLEWAIFAFGDMTIGVPAALSASGLADRVKIGGVGATEANLQALRDGKETVWTGLTAPVLGWRLADAAARVINGDDISPANEAILPTQLITGKNVGGIVTTDKGYYLGLQDYPEQFKKPWLVG